MKKNLLLFIFCCLINAIAIKVFSQKNYSIRTNVLNAIAKGPSLTFGKYVNDNHELLITYSQGSFNSFLQEDFYKYTTLSSEYRIKLNDFSHLNYYFGPYIRYIHKTIITEGYTAGPYGLFSKSSRNFRGNGISTGLTLGSELIIKKKWLLDFNTLLGGGKYLSQIDYEGNEKINFFLDSRIALQVGFQF